MTRTVTRVGAFETNSSSSHSLSIQGGTYIADRADLSVIYPGEFGWGEDTFTDAETKASYAWTWVCAVAESERDRLTQMLTRVITVQTGVTPSFHGMVRESWDATSGYVSAGYIDHQSGPGEDGDGQRMWETDATLRDFIFNPASVLHIDNDNH